MDTSGNKRIMLVSDFYYGQFEGDRTEAVQKTNTTFKCQSCLKILKSNVRYDDVFSCPEVTQGWQSVAVLSRSICMNLSNQARSD